MMAQEIITLNRWQPVQIGFALKDSVTGDPVTLGEDHYIMAIFITSTGSVALKMTSHDGSIERVSNSTFVANVSSEQMGKLQGSLTMELKLYDADNTEVNIGCQPVYLKIRQNKVGGEK